MHNQTTSNTYTAVNREKILQYDQKEALNRDLSKLPSEVDELAFCNGGPIRMRDSRLSIGLPRKEVRQNGDSRVFRTFYYEKSYCVEPQKTRF